MMQEIDKADVRALLKTYFDHGHGRQLVKHLTDSYADFILRRMELIIDGFNPIETSHGFDPDRGLYNHILSIELKNPVLTKPMIHERDGRFVPILYFSKKYNQNSYAGFH